MAVDICLYVFTAFISAPVWHTPKLSEFTHVLTEGANQHYEPSSQAQNSSELDTVISRSYATVEVMLDGVFVDAVLKCQLVLCCQ